MIALNVQANGLSVRTICKSKSTIEQAQIDLNILRTIDYNQKVAKVEVSFDGQAHWDAEPYRVSGSFQSPLPLKPAPVPNLPETFSVTNAQSSLSVRSMDLLKSKDRTPLVARVIELKVPTDPSGISFFQRWAYLKIVVGAGRNSSAFGMVYIVDKDMKDISTPDGGGNVNLECSEEVHDI
jgi:hypothetical protein